ncbi:hypothetical protein [Nonomuraea sp. NPDC050786]|uniref:hypothetical protein n=1 Tax=Nonomuraea sp. NPDC050786 TaxID=3154840 RepID=UPI0033D8C7C4
MGKYDQQTNDLYLTLHRAGIPAVIDRDGDEHTVTVPMPDTDRTLVFDPTDDGCYDLDQWTGRGTDYPLIESIAENVGDNSAAAIVTGLLLANLPPATTSERVYYDHAQRSILLVENGQATPRLVGHAFDNPIACMVVAMLNAAIRAGRATGGNSSYWIDGDRVYAQHGPNGPKQALAVEGLSSEARSALAYELHQAGQMGAYT